MSTKFEKGYALLIGVSDQQNPSQAPILPETENDVNTLSEILKDPQKSGYLPENVVTLKGKDATRINIIKKLIWLKKSLVKNPEATAIIYFSGHGYHQKSENKYYLIPYDFDIDLPEETAIEDSYFSKKIGTINAPRLLLLLDCCHAGKTNAGLTLASDMSSQAANLNAFITSDSSKPVGDDKKQRDNPNGSKPVGDDKKQRDNPNGSKPVGDDKKQRDNPNGSKPADNGSANGRAAQPTRAVLVSSRGSELSYIHKTTKMSVFTYHLVEALNGHGKSKKEDSVVNVLDLMSHVLDSVPATTKEQYQQNQTPNARYNGENFPIALLMGGQGLQVDEVPPSVEQVITTVNGNGNILSDIINGNVSIDNSVGKTTTNIGGDNFAGATFGGGITKGFGWDKDDM